MTLEEEDFSGLAPRHRLRGNGLKKFSSQHSEVTSMGKVKLKVVFYIMVGFYFGLFFFIKVKQANQALES